MKALFTPLLLLAPLLLGAVQEADAQKPDILVPEILHGFESGIPAFDSGAVAHSTNGNYYGVSAQGGGFGKGTFFELVPGSTPTITILTAFGDPTGDARGEGPVGPLVEDASGQFYGVTSNGGRFGFGTVFRVQTDGTILTLVDFSGVEGAAPGAHPRAALTFGSDGNLYGVASGNSHHGVKSNAFRVSPNGTYEVLFQFTGKTGAFPGDFADIPLLRLSDDTFVGATQSGGAANTGVLFRLNATGGDYTKIASFSNAPDSATNLKGQFPFSTLVQKPDGTVYGVSRGALAATNVWQFTPSTNKASTFAELSQISGGGESASNVIGGPVLRGSNLLLAFSFDSSQQRGGLYSVDTDGSLNKVVAFDLPTGSNSLASGLNGDGAGGYLGTQNGRLYGYNTSLDYIADGNADNGTGVGARPDGPIAFGAANTAYGHCAQGGANQAGTIFQYPTTGGLSALTSLDPVMVGGTLFNTALTPKANGELLFIAPFGGTDKRGAIYKADGSGIVSEVAAFTIATPNNFARSPGGRLTPDGAGNFYAEASPGSFSSPDAAAVFKLDNTDTLSLVGNVPRFGTPDNNSIAGDRGLTFDAGKTSLYGVVQNFTTPTSKGYIYNLTLSGTATQVVNLDSGTNKIGAGRPIAPIIPEPSSGGFIFSTSGPSDRTGLEQLVRLTSTNTLQRLYQFDTRDFDFSPAGSFQNSPLVLDPATGNIFGVNQYGGAFGGGTLFRRSANGDFDVLHHFRAGADLEAAGLTPVAGLTLGPDGLIYGTASVGGPLGGGTLFRFAPKPGATPGANLPPLAASNSAVVLGQLTNNGYAGAYFYRFGTVSGSLDQGIVSLPFTGFYGTTALPGVIPGLKGHTTYFYELHATVGTGTDAQTVTAAEGSFTTLNGVPFAQNDNIIGDTLAGPFTGIVLDNDSDPDGDPVTIQSVSNGAFGTVTINPDKTLTYTPGPSFTGTDTFTYTIADDQPMPATSTATVTVTTADTAIGDYAGLLVEESPLIGPGLPEGPQAIGPVDRLIAGLVQMSISKNRAFSARFSIGARTVVMKGRLNGNRDTRLVGDRGRFTGALRVGPFATEARVTYNGRTLVLRAGQAFAAVPGATPPPKSDYTMRFTPESVANPVGTPGVPFGVGTGIIRLSTKGRATVLGTLPDGTKFSRASVIDSNRHFPFQASLYKGGTGSLDGELVLTANTGEVDAAPLTTIRWIKSAQPKDKRFPGGFTTRMAVYGGKYTVPGKNIPPLAAPNATLLATFNRGGLFAPTGSRFTLNGAKPVVDTAANEAKSTLKFTPRTGMISGTFKMGTKAMKYTGIVVQRDQKATGYFLGAADTGSVQIAEIP